MTQLAYPRSRLLVQEPELFDRRPYEGWDIRPATGGMRLASGSTVGVNGKSPEDTMIGNLADMSEWADAPLALYMGGSLPTWLNGSRLVAVAYGGVTIRATGDLDAAALAEMIGWSK